ncbi:MAG: hypothetical protein GF331_10530 [Chitinivibrionales bacterium]|nr:hypothetical protein [Chitinivibrionales bacterium]
MRRPQRRFVLLPALWLLATGVVCDVSSQDECVIGGIASGYGADGAYSMHRDSISSPHWDRRFLYVFRPVEGDGPWPTVILLHTYGSTDPVEYDRFITHIVSRGYAVIYPVVRPVTFTRKQLFKYRMAFDGVDTAVSRYRQYLDTTRVGIVGHGFGGGMAPSMGHTYFEQRAWGAKGAFLFIMAPWYACGIDQREMETFPEHVKMVVQIYEDDRTNDPRIAQDIFDNIGIPAGEKDFMVIKSDRHGTCRLRANNHTPLSDEAFGGENNALDYYGIYKTFDALAAYTFVRERGAKTVALGGGSEPQCYMGRWADGTRVEPAVVTDSPSEHIQSGFYANQWTSVRNPRMEVSAFKKGRKIFFRHWRRKIRAVVKTAAGKLRARQFRETPDEQLRNPIVEGFGADGDLGWVADSFENPSDDDVQTYVFLPDSAGYTPPVVFVMPGYSGTEPKLFFPLIPHMVSRGIAVVFSPYPILPAVTDSAEVMGKLEVAWAGVTEAIARYADRLDTTRTGFFGQSFGGGITPALVYRALKEKKWGKDGAFLFLAAPWYLYGLTEEQLAAFPEQVKMVVQVYDDDRVNDHQMAVDIFRRIGIPASEKDYVIVHSDSVEGMAARANHFVPYGSNNIYGTEDILDYYGVFRLLDALAETAFSGSPEGRRVALGNGDELQVFMGELDEGRPFRQLTVTDEPRARHSQLLYMWAWDNRINPWRDTLSREQAEPEPEPEPIDEADLWDQRG